MDPLKQLAEHYSKKESRLDELTKRVQPRETIDWKTVDIIIDGYRDRHPVEYIGCLKIVQDKRTSLKNQFAELSTNTAMRHMYEMPPMLIRALEMLYPDILKGKNLIKFLKRYPFFRVADVL